MLEQTPLISEALNLWVATRITERSWRICGCETLGLEPVSESENPWRGCIPVTPIMDTQLDDIAINGLLLPSSTRLLQLLEQKMEKRKKEDWFEIFVTIFIVMSNVEFILADVVDYTERHGMKVSCAHGHMPTITQH